MMSGIKFYTILVGIFLLIVATSLLTSSLSGEFAGESWLLFVLLPLLFIFFVIAIFFEVKKIKKESNNEPIKSFFRLKILGWIYLLFGFYYLLRTIILKQEVGSQFFGPWPIVLTIAILLITLALLQIYLSKREKIGSVYLMYFNFILLVVTWAIFNAYN